MTSVARTSFPCWHPPSDNPAFQSESPSVSYLPVSIRANSERAIIMERRSHLPFIGCDSQAVLSSIVMYFVICCHSLCNVPCTVVLLCN